MVHNNNQSNPNMGTHLLSQRSQAFENADQYAVSHYINEHVGGHPIRLPRACAAQARLKHLRFSSLDLCPQCFIRERKRARINACLSKTNCNVRNVTDLALDHVSCIFGALCNIPASRSVSCLRILSNVVLRNLRKA